MRPNLKMTRFFKRSESKKNTFLIDAKGKTLGRISSEIAKILMGKHKPTYTPNEDMGDHVVIVNARHIHVTGSKAANKTFSYHTGYMGGHREIDWQTMIARNPEFIIKTTVWGMMPNSRLANAQMKKLRVFKDENHNLTTEMVKIEG